MSKFGHLYPWQTLTRAAGARLACRVGRRLSFDTGRLQAETAAIIAAFSAAAHSRHDHHDGGWGAIGLIAHDGNPHEDRLRFPLSKTPALALAPYIDSLIESLAADKLRVRLMELRPQASIFWHYDKGESIDDGSSLRLHLPIVTNRQVQAQISHEDQAWSAGELWYGDFSFPHRLINGGDHNRIHLVIDLKPNDFVLSLFPADFLAGKQRRLRVKRTCQRLLDLYALGRLPRGKRARRILAALGLASTHKVVARPTGRVA